MNPGARKWISRKELAMATELSVDTITRNEAKLGLDQCKVVVNERVILYHREPALRRVEHLTIIMAGTV